MSIDDEQGARCQVPSAWCQPRQRLCADPDEFDATSNGSQPCVIRLIAALMASSLGYAVGYAAPAIKATLDTDEHVAAPVPHRYVHGVIPDDAKFQLALPDTWNGRLVIFSRGFSGTELSTGSFKISALEKGYAFAASGIPYLELRPIY